MLRLAIVGSQACVPGAHKGEETWPGPPLVQNKWKKLLHRSQADSWATPSLFLMILAWTALACGMETMRTKQAVLVLASIVAVATGTPLSAEENDLVAPDIVRLEESHVVNGINFVAVASESRRYSLTCSVKSTACITPKKDKKYLLFTKNTKWKMPGATGFINLEFIQDWTVKYNSGENIGLVPEGGGGPNELGMYLLDEGGYDQDFVVKDGPIFYGRGLSDEDRQKAWKNFFLMMIEGMAGNMELPPLNPA